MKKRIVVVIVFILVALLALSTSGLISAKSVRTDVESLEYDCFTGFAENGRVWQEGDILHIRNVLHSNINFSDTAELVGVHSNVASGDINLATGHTSIRGKSVWQPDGFDGAWVGHWTWLTNEQFNQGWGVFRGTGELSGKLLFTNVFDEYEPPPNPTVCDVFCAGEDPETCYYEGAVRTKGYILEIGVAPAEQLPVSTK